MGHFQHDDQISLECFNMLVPLADTLATCGFSVKVFDAVEVAMRTHMSQNDLLAHGIHALARLGPVFMAHEHRGIKAIVSAMARHRSCVKLQRVGNKALFNLSSQDDCLKRCRMDGAVTAVVNAMTA